MDTVKENHHQDSVRTDVVAEQAAGPEPAQAPKEWSKLRKLALRQLNRFVSLEAKVLKGDDPEAIHDIRVASRRLQQVFDLIYSDHIPREGRQLRRKIRRCRRALGDVRNCDVLLQNVGAHLARKRCSRREAWMAVQQYLQERRSESFSKAIRKLSKVNLALLYLHAKEMLEPLRSASGQNGELRPLDQTDANLPEPFIDRITQALVKVWTDFEKQVTLSHREPTVVAIHGARLRAKRLRYLLEVVDEFGIPGSSEALAWLKKIQEHLGDWHDMQVLEESMITMVANPDFLRDHLPLAMAIERLILRGRATGEKIKERYFQMALDSPQHQRVRHWVAGLKTVTSDK